jgi:hypothetical protein
MEELKPHYSKRVGPYLLSVINQGPLGRESAILKVPPGGMPASGRFLFLQSGDYTKCFEKMHTEHTVERFARIMDGL